MTTIKSVAQIAGKPRFFKEESARRRAAAVIDHGRHHFVGEIAEERGITVMGRGNHVAQAHVPIVAVVAVVAGEKIQIRINGHVVNVARALGHDFQPGAVGPHPHDAAAVDLNGRAVLAHRVQSAVIAQRDVKPAVNAHAHAVASVVGPPESQVVGQPAHQHFGAVGRAAAVSS